MTTATLLRPIHTPTSTTEEFDSSIASDGLTVDSILGPVDLIAIDHARLGRPVTLTPAEVEYLLTSTRTA